MRGALAAAVVLSILACSGTHRGGREKEGSPGKGDRVVVPSHLNELHVDETAHIEKNLRSHLAVIAGEIGERNLSGARQELQKTARYIEQAWKKMGYRVGRLGYDVAGEEVFNLEISVPGSRAPEEIVIAGAHYDSVPFSPAANDNGSGVAAMLELSRLLKGFKSHRSIRFVAFVNEEPPYFQTDEMGSYRYAKACREKGEEIVAMLSLETIGYYSDQPGSQHYPGGLPRQLTARYPTVGNFIMLVGDEASKPLVDQCKKLFEAAVDFPVEAVALPEEIPGISWSDHWSFWQFGYPAIMVTDTAPLRYPHYHEAGDTPDKLDYARTAEVVQGLKGVIAALSQTDGTFEGAPRR